MNKEALPLIVAILVPILLVSLILLYFYGYDFTLFFLEIDLIYYIILLPFILGTVAGIFKLRQLESQFKYVILAHSIALIGVAGYGIFSETVRYPMFGFYFWMYAGMVAKLMSDKKIFTKNI